MILAVSLCAAALVIGFTAPIYLRSLLAPNLNPGLALSAWTISMVLFVATLLAAPIALLTGPWLHIPKLQSLALICVKSLQDEGQLPWLPFAELMLGSAALALVLRIGIVGFVTIGRHRRNSAEHLAMLRVVCDRRSADGSTELLWLTGAHPAAYSIDAGGGVVVATNGLSTLAPEQRRAVLGHERAHLRGRHHLLVLFAEVLRAALPFVPLCREAPAWLRVLTELEADHRAAHEVGPDVVRAALVQSSDRKSCSGNAQVGMPWMSPELVPERLDWLDAMPMRRRLSATVDYPVGGLLSALPAVTVAVAVVGAFCLS